MFFYFYTYQNQIDFYSILNMFEIQCEKKTTTKKKQDAFLPGICGPDADKISSSISYS